MTALTYQSQLTATTVANSSQQMGQYIQTLAHQQANPSKPASNDGADGGSFVQSERCRTRHRTPRTWSASNDGPICPKRIRTQHLRWLRRTGAWTWARSRPWPTCIYCRMCTLQDTRDYLRLQAEDIMRHRPQCSSPPPYSNLMK